MESMIIGYENIIDSMAKALCKVISESESWEQLGQLGQTAYRLTARQIMTELVNDLASQLPAAKSHLN